MAKILTVATEVQKTVFTEVLLGEIATGFWKNVRPADHADSWKGVTVVVNETNLGASGFDVPRNYNFVNPDFLHKSEEKMLAVAKTVDPDITIKKLRKQLILLSRSVGGRIKQVGGPITKLERGQSRRLQNGGGNGVKATSTKTSKTVVRKVAANLVDPTTLTGGAIPPKTTTAQAA
jgi:hypothetical protein